MNDFSASPPADEGQPAHRPPPRRQEGLRRLAQGSARARIRQAASAQGFRGEGYQLAILPGDKAETGRPCSASPMSTSSAPGASPRRRRRLPEGNYRLEGRGPGPAALGWLLAQYRFDRYKKAERKAGPRVLLTSEPARIDETVRLAEAVDLVRDLVNIPAGGHGPGRARGGRARVAADAAREVRGHLGRRRSTRAIR